MIKTALKYKVSAEQIVHDLVEDFDLDEDTAKKCIEEYQKNNA